MGKCLFETLPGAVDNSYLRNLDDVAIDLIYEPGGFPQRSGFFNNLASGKPLTMRVITKNVYFASNNQATKVVTNTDDNVARSFGTTADGTIVVGPKENIALCGTFPTMTEHWKEFPLSADLCNWRTLFLQTVGDESRVFGLNDIANMTRIKAVLPNVGVGLSLLNDCLELDLENLLQLWLENGNACRFSISYTPATILRTKFHNLALSSFNGGGGFGVEVTESAVTCYQNGHIGEAGYELATYDGSAWTYFV